MVAAEVEQKKTILNLYNSGITPDIIALQMDITQNEVKQVIENEISEEKRKKINAQRMSDAPLLSKLYLDAVVNLDSAIKNAQIRMWKALKAKSEINDISMEETQNVLGNYAESKVNLVILNIDLVESTKLSMTLPVDKLATIIRAFTQEMSLMIEVYGGYVLKYVGDAILAFFIASSSDNSSSLLYLPCINAINCACSMIKVIQQGINPILDQYDYPELNVRIGIDVGENAVVQYGWDTHMHKNGKVILKKPHLDILGYTISIAAKMTVLAKPGQIIIGQLVYNILEDKQKSAFRLLSISSDIWDYVSNYTGKTYSLYGSL
ncbi:MAG: adenylate/guanylate cyclase domain-containing protein [Nitrososphaeraceae archaeon]|nr:adenylate/guanylate cyclase domain-containing protein [Nitrososphaeraceae archaeon]